MNLENQKLDSKQPFKQSFRAVIEKFSAQKKLYLVHIMVPNDIYQQFAEAGINRIIATFNGSKPVHNAFLSDKERGRYIKMSNDIMKEKSLAIGQEIEVNIEEDTSRYGMPIPEEMEELLTLDPDGEKLFHSLSPGKIRSLLFKVNGYKSSDKRIEKSVIILEHLKANNGVLDWKMLNEAWKTGLQL